MGAPSLPPLTHSSTQPMIRNQILIEQTETQRSIREILAEQKRILEETRQSLAERRAHLVQSNTTPRVPIHTTTAPQTFKPAIIVKVPGQERELPFKVKIMRKQEILHRQSSISPDKRTLIENWLEDMDKS